MIFKGHKDKRGTTEEFTTFAILPITLVSGDTVWLEKVKVVRTYFWGNWTNSLLYKDEVYRLKEAL